MYIIDIDGTIADGSHREGFLYDHRIPVNLRRSTFFRNDYVFKDKLIPGAAVLNDMMQMGVPIAFLSGRPEHLKETTIEWLKANLPSFNEHEHTIVLKPDAAMGTSTAEWKAQEVSKMTGGQPFTFIDNDEENLQKIIDLFPNAKTLHPSDAWDGIKADLRRSDVRDDLYPQEVDKPKPEEQPMDSYQPQFGIEENDQGAVDEGMRGEEDYSEDDDL